MKRLTATTALCVLFCTAFAAGKGPAATVPGSYPDSLRSVWLYTEGIKQNTIFHDTVRAREYLTEAIRADSTYAPAYYEMATNGMYSTPDEAVELARSGSFDLIILDLMMPKIDGLQACMRIREFSNVPIIMLTARSEDTDKIIGFECGADDYITKPFNILELKARVRALLRRAGMAAQKQGGGRLSMGHITLDVDARAAWKDGKSVDLTAKEFDLMELLLRNPGRVYSRENLLNVVWGYEYAGDYRTVDVHVRRLREKLELDPANPEYILTKWGVGYYLKHG